MAVQPSAAKFELGRLVATPHALQTVNDEDVRFAVLRHLAGDWGDVCEEDRQANQLALDENLRLLSVYQDRNGIKFWIITEADRSATTVLLPDDY